jgi:prevent-host-death family protein
MTRVKIAELKDHLSEHLRAVEGGREIEVMDRNRPIARIAPIRKGGRPADILPARRRLSPADMKPLPSAGWPAGSLELLLEERRDR